MCVVAIYKNTFSYIKKEPVAGLQGFRVRIYLALHSLKGSKGSGAWDRGPVTF